MRHILFFFFALFILGCSQESPQSGTVFDEQVEAIDKAKEVEGQIQDATKQLDEALKQQ
ncbi:MAG: hypothetical protein AAF384_07530 [Pseudomonadota bacterium]